MITWLIGLVIAGAVGLVFMVLEYWDFGGSSSGRPSDDNNTATGDGGTDWFWGDADSSASDSGDSGGDSGGDGGGDGGGGD